MGLYTASNGAPNPIEEAAFGLISSALKKATGYDADTLLEWREIMAPDVAEDLLQRML